MRPGWPEEQQGVRPHPGRESLKSILLACVNRKSFPSDLSLSGLRLSWVLKKPLAAKTPSSATEGSVPIRADGKPEPYFANRWTASTIVSVSKSLRAVIIGFVMSTYFLKCGDAMCCRYAL